MTAGRQVALVTGAGGGLGQAIASALARDGFRLVVVGRSVDPLVRLSDRLRSECSDADIDVETCDVGEESAVRSLMDGLARNGRTPEVLVNNAAVQGPIGPFAEADWPAWRHAIAIDLLGPALLTQLAVPSMIERGWGRVINISGGGATGPRPDFTAYAVAKTGLVRLTETLANELAGSGVTVNAVAPGPMNTRMLDEVIEAGPVRASREYDAAVARAKEQGAPLETAAALVSWLVSSAADGVSGRLLSAVWDPWQELGARCLEIADTDIYTLRRIVPKDRGKSWGALKEK